MASISVGVGMGSRYESSSGLCSVLHSATLAELQAKLGMVTGSVTREGMFYTATVMKESAGAAAKTMAAAVSSGPSAAAFESAKAEALAAYTPTPLTSADLLEELHACAYLDTAMGAPIKGDAASLAGLTLEPFKGSVTVAAVGAPAADVAAAFEGLPAASALVEASPAIFTGSDKKISYDSHDVARICLGYEFPSLNTGYAAAATLLPYVLAAPPQAATSSFDPFNSHAKLTRDIAEQAPKATAEPFYVPYSDTALFGVTIVAPDTSVEDCMWYTCNNLVRLCHDVSESELARAKLVYKSKLLSDLASPPVLAASMAKDLALLGQFIPPAELIARTDDLELKQIKDLAYTFIHDNDHALAAVGPLHELPDYNWVRTASYNYHY